MSRYPDTVKLVLNSHSKKTKNDFKDQLSLNAGQKYCRMLQESILQYFRPALNYHLSFETFILSIFSGRLRQVLLYFGSEQNVLIRLCRCVGCSAPLLFKNDFKPVFTWGGSNIFLPISFNICFDCSKNYLIETVL